MKQFLKQSSPAVAYLVYASTPTQRQGTFIGRIEGSTSLLDAAKQVAELLFFRQAIRQVALLVSSREGIFIAHGKVSWVRHPKGRAEEVRFLIREETEAEAKKERERG